MLISVWTMAASIAACASMAAQDREAPAVAQGGIANLASRIPIQVPMGGAAPGSLISIRAFRVSPAPPDTVLVRIRRGEARVETTALAVDENEIDALVPNNAPLGSALLQVVKNGHASLEWPIEIVDSRFGAFSRNGQGWGPGQIWNAAGAPNSEAQPAQPGEAVRIAGTGLGLGASRHTPPQILVAGRPASGVVVADRAADRPGIDTISFHLPADAPEGCHVPVQVRSGAFYSNGVTIAISRDGSPCAIKPIGPPASATEN